MNNEEYNNLFLKVPKNKTTYWKVIDDGIFCKGIRIDHTALKSKWIKQGRFGRTYRCEYCGNLLDFSGVNVGRGSANFCPNCGGAMEL